MTFNQPPYGQQWGGAPAPYSPAQSTNAVAIGAFVSAWILPPLGIVLGHVARAQIRHRGESGSGLALAALIISYTFTILAIVVIVLAVVIAVAVTKEVSHVNQVLRTIH